MTRARAHRGRTLALVAACGVIAVAALAAMRRERLATRYYLYRLQSDASYLEHLLDLPELRSSQEVAVREYCETDEGGTAVVSLYCAHSQQLDASDVGLAAVHQRRVDRWRRVRRWLKFIADGREFTLERYPNSRLKVEWHDDGPTVRGVPIAPKRD